MSKIVDIARELGISVSTVSRALTRPEKVSAATRERVLRVAEQQGYEANEFARNLRQGSSRTIGLIVADITNRFYSTIVQAVQDVAYEQNYVVMVGHTQEDAEREAAFLKQLRSHQLQGLIIAPTHNTRKNLEELRDIPVVEVDRTTGVIGTSAVLSENAGGMENAARHLYDLGHRNVAYIGGNTGTSSFKERLTGFRRVYPEAPHVVELPVSMAHEQVLAARQATMMLFNLPSSHRPTAVITANNELTAGVVKGLNEMALRWPDDVSLVGYDDPAWAELLPVPITAVAQPTYEIGAAAARVLLQRIQSGEKASADLRLETKLRVRRSTGPALAQENHAEIDGTSSTYDFGSTAPIRGAPRSTGS